MTRRKAGEFLFAGRGTGAALTTRQYARLVGQWIASIGLDPLNFGTHSLRRTKATLIAPPGEQRSLWPSFLFTLTGIHWVPRNKR
jgi:hypothetical protein